MLDFVARTGGFRVIFEIFRNALTCRWCIGSYSISRKYPSVHSKPLQSINFQPGFGNLPTRCLKGFHFTNFQNLVLATTFHVPFEPQQNFDIKITRFVKLHNFLKIESLARCEKGYVDSCKDGFSFHNACERMIFAISMSKTQSWQKNKLKLGPSVSLSHVPGLMFVYVFKFKILKALQFWVNSTQRFQSNPLQQIIFLE